MHSDKPLRYPPHFPPANRWKRFFMGVRWLGPDTSFFSELRMRQNARTPESMNIWGGGSRQELANALGTVFAKFCNWPSPYFLPDDDVSVIAGGSTFGWVDNIDIDKTISSIEKIVGVNLTSEFWEVSGSETLRQLVDRLLVARQA